MLLNIILCVLGIIFSCYLIITLRKQEGVPRIVPFFLGISFITWYAIPILLSIFHSFKIFENMIHISLNEYLKLAFKELIFYIIILLLFKFSFKIKNPFKNISIIESNSISDSNSFIKSCIAFSIIMLIYNMIMRSDYDKNNEIGQAQGGIFFILQYFVSYIISFYWINIIFNQKSKYQNFYIIFILINSVFAIIAGARIHLLSLLYLYFFVNIKLLSVGKKLRFFTPFIAIFLASLIVLPILSAKRTGHEADLSSQDLATITELVLIECNIKLNSIAYSSALLEYDGEGFAGFKPYLGSLFKYIPRFIWKDKPTPTSFNNDISGTPARRAPYLYGVVNETQNVGVSAYSVSSWQSGIYTIILSIILNVIYLIIINTFLKNNSLYLNAIGLQLFYFPQLIMTPSYGDNIIQKLLEILIIISILLLFKVIKFKVIRETTIE